MSYKLLQINYYTFILNMYVLILFGRDYTISELFGFFHRLMLALLPIYLSTNIFLDAYQVFFWKRYAKTTPPPHPWKYLTSQFFEKFSITFTVLRELWWAVFSFNLIKPEVNPTKIRPLLTPQKGNKPESRYMNSIGHNLQCSIHTI